MTKVSQKTKLKKAARNEAGVIGLISAVPEEGLLLAKELRPIEQTNKGRLQVYAGKIAGRRVVYVISGMGKVNAAHAGTILINDWNPRAVVNFGIGGAYSSSGLKVGDVAVAVREVYADEGLWMKDGINCLEATGIPLVKKSSRKYFNTFPLDRRLASAALRAVRSVGTGKAGPFLTLSACTGTKARAQELEARFKAICENMEGAAVAHISLIYGLPCAEIRGISNIVEDRDRCNWNIPLAADRCQAVLRKLLESPYL